jgi:SRSO17 transposase
VAEERELEKEDIADIKKRLDDFLEPFRDRFERHEQAVHAAVYIQGRLRKLARRTIEPIANDKQLKRRPLQHFIGAGKWEDDGLRQEMVRQIGGEMGRKNGVLILDGSGFHKSGPESAGTQRQWCGRLGKEEQCQVGEFLAYAAGGSVTLLDCELYLPKSWAEDATRREKCHIPSDVIFKTGWELAAGMVFRHRAQLPHRWVVGDENYGRPTELRDLFARESEQYMLEVAANTKVRLVRGGDWTHANQWADKLPGSAWQEFTVRDGEKGPITVRAVKTRVYTPRPQKGVSERPEVLVIVHNDRDSKSWTYLASDTKVPLRELVRVGSCRHGIEQALEMAKGDVGLDEYEVRSWVGWHHHMTLTIMALWFLVQEQRWLKKRGWSLPSHKFVEFWPTSSPPDGPSNNSPSAQTRRRTATSKHAVTIGHGDVADLRRGFKSERQWTESSNRTRSMQLAQSN